jgi:GPH family glycoside/pentoside/hexuronide:cation symporter
MAISLREKISYGLGDAASNLVFTTILSFMMFFYTDIFKIPAAQVGMLFLFSRVLDGFLDFSMGAIADRTRSRFGSFRPYILWMALPFSVFFILAFSTPDLDERGRIIYAWITYNALMIAYTAINIPYSALSGVMTDDPKERNDLSSFRIALAQVGGLVINGCTLPLVNYFANGDPAHGYRMTVIIFAVLALLLFMLTFVNTRERIVPLPQQHSTVLQDVALLFKSVPWRVMTIAAILMFVAIIIQTGAVMYYFHYVVPPAAIRGNAVLLLLGWSDWDGNDLATLFLAAGSAAGIAGAASATFFAQYVGKLTSFIVACVLCAAGLMLFYFTPVTSLELLFLEYLSVTAMTSVVAALYFSILADVADYGEWHYQVRTTGLIFASGTCAAKIGMGIGGALSGWLLGYFGYVSNQMQTAAASHGITLMLSLVPAFIFLSIAALMHFTYTLDAEKLAHIKQGLQQRRQTLASA